jgi:hypothetical protein
LKGNLKSFYSIRVIDQWRIIFKWIEGEAHGVRPVRPGRGDNPPFTLSTRGFTGGGSLPLAHPAGACASLRHDVLCDPKSIGAAIIP